MRMTFFSHEIKYRIIKQTKKKTKFIYFNADEIHLLGLWYIYGKWCIVFSTFFFTYISLRSRNGMEHCIYLLYLTRIFITEMIHFNNYLHSFLLLCDLSSLIQYNKVPTVNLLSVKKNMYKNPFLFARKIFNNFAYFICVSES